MTIQQINNVCSDNYGCGILAIDPVGALWVAERILRDSGINVFKRISSHRNKYGIGLDLKHPDGLGVLRRMVVAADVLVHNFRPAVPARLGTDSQKWQKYAGRDILPLWVADMDYKAPDVVLDASATARQNPIAGAFAADTTVGGALVRAGYRVVTAGQGRLEAGMRVRVLP